MEAYIMGKQAWTKLNSFLK